MGALGSCLTLVACLSVLPRMWKTQKNHLVFWGNQTFCLPECAVYCRSIELWRFLIGRNCSTVCRWTKCLTKNWLKMNLVLLCAFFLFNKCACKSMREQIMCRIFGLTIKGGGGGSSTIGFIFMTVLDYYAKSGWVHSRLSSFLQVLRRQEVDPQARRPTAAKSKLSLSLRNFDTSAHAHANAHTHAFYPFPTHPLSPRRERMRMSGCSAPAVSRSSISLCKSYATWQLKLVFSRAITSLWRNGQTRKASITSTFSSLFLFGLENVWGQGLTDGEAVWPCGCRMSQ